MSDVVYLLGAGASHACALYRKSKRGILMSSLAEHIRSLVRNIAAGYRSSASIVRFVNDMTDDTDIEHVITFFEDSNSSEHKRFANDLRSVFFKVLQEALDDISDNSDPRDARHSTCTGVFSVSVSSLPNGLHLAWRGGRGCPVGRDPRCTPRAVVSRRISPKR